MTLRSIFVKESSIWKGAASTYYRNAICLFLNRYLYTLDFPENRVINQPDQTLEILMSELDPVVMDQFYMKDGVTANDVTRVCLLRILNLIREEAGDL